VRAVGFGFPLVINDGFVLRRLGGGLGSRLGIVAAIMVVVPATGGDNSGRQCGAQKAQGEFSQEHCFPFVWNFGET
jgi:hypothetical protein